MNGLNNITIYCMKGPRGDDASFKQEFLETHNTYRARHGAQPLTYNSELNAAAQKWADHLLQTNSSEHSKSGENIFNMSSSEPLKLTGKEAVESWYNEIKDYNWGRPGFSGSTGHFTQVVWKESIELGVGLATDGNNVFVVGQYRPPGNMLECFEKNVLPQAGREAGGADNTSNETAGVSPRKICTLL
ncbi:Golgi-associated plant pathogenesis-related protein 1-like [Thunnus albacares]|uniref:Golgi-associated plant pathogenesis-related protein 1-like n=1 Tax=Thunnus albacares TaxID=8236 RepID=UPI001CF63BDB|nr:Golgi-associated plant pathogenesis-related protein 1-like [Thunnus albacares]